MSTQTEALKLALEQALEMLNDNREYIEANERAEYLAMYDKAIAGAEKALAEQPAPAQEPVEHDWTEWKGGSYGGDRPVPGSTKVLVKFRDESIDYEFARAFDWDHGKGINDLVAYLVVNASPQAQPAREWAGLTEAEKRQLFERVDCQGGRDYINTIESKLKEKNT